MAFLDNTGVARLVTDLKGKLAAIVHTHAAKRYIAPSSSITIA